MKNKNNIIVNDISYYTNEYQNQVKKKNSRLRAWEYCYKAFNDVHNSHKNSEVTEFEYDYLCLNLATYLANWGMLRNSFLLERDYKIHRPIVEELLKANECLWGMKVDQYNSTALNELVRKINEKYESIREEVYSEKGKETPEKRISNTLITKILMGTLGCVPAFDRYFTYAIKELISAPKSYDVNSMKKLVEFYIKNYDEFEHIRKTMKIDNSDLEYPQMKLLDMFFWQYGKEHKKD